MKKSSRILLVALSLLAAWFLGYIHVPSLSDLAPSVVGILFGITLTLLFFLLFNQTVKQAGKGIRNWLVLIVMVSAITALVSIVMMPDGTKQFNSDFAAQIEQLNEAYKDSANALARKQIPNLIHELTLEAQQDSLKRLSERSIYRLSALSNQLTPTVTYNNLSDSLVKMSAERGQLFLQIIQLNLDSASFEAIKKQVDFSYADLRNSDLSSLNLSNTQLKNAHFENAKLDSVNFIHAALHHAHFNGAQLSCAVFKHSNLEGADFSWSTATSAKFNNAHMNGAVLNNARFSDVDLSNTSAEWASFITTDLSNANLEAANLKRAYLTRTNLNNCSLRKTSLYRAEIVEASFLNASFDSVLVYDADWIRNFKTQNGLGLDSFEENYQIIQGKKKSENWIIPRLKMRFVESSEFYARISSPLGLLF